MSNYLLSLLIFLLLGNSIVFGATLDDSTLTGAQLISEEQNSIRVDQQVMIVADLQNGQDREQKFAYLVQIKNQNGVVVSLSWLTGTLDPRQFLSPAQSWTPSESGTYTIQIFVWESVDNPDALSRPLTLIVDVV